MQPEDPLELPLLIEVARSPKPRLVEELALVLTARGIGAQVGRGPATELPRFALLVDEGDAPRARAELELYQRENRSWPRRLAPYQARPGAAKGSLWYAAVLLVFFAFQQRAGGTWQLGIADAQAILGGHIELAWSALLLHADLVHLAGNLFFGALFGFLVAAEIGSGPAWLAILLAGGLGNLGNAWLYVSVLGREHHSLGASTGVFGAVGLLATLEWGRRRSGPDSRWRKLAPPIMALVMLGLYGAAGERTDVSAHVWGLLAGVGLGGLLLPLRARLVGRVPGAMGLAAGLLMLVVIGLVWS